MAALEDRREAGQPIERGSAGTLVLVQEDWQIEPARAVAPGAAVWTMADAEYGTDLLELAAREDELVLPYSAIDFRELQARALRRKRPAVTGGRRVEAIRERINRAGLGGFHDAVKGWQAKGLPARDVIRARSAVKAANDAVAEARKTRRAVEAAAGRLDGLETEAAGLSVIGRLRRGKMLEEDIQAAKAELKARLEEEREANAALAATPTVTEEMRDLARQFTRSEVAGFCKRLADAARRDGVLNVVSGDDRPGAVDQIRLVGWKRNWKVTAHCGRELIRVTGEDAVAAAVAHFAGTGCSMAFDDVLRKGMEREPEEWVPAGRLPEEPPAEARPAGPGPKPEATADRHSGPGF